MGKILLLEDDKSLNRGISFKLKKEGFEVETAFCIEEAKNIFDNNKIDLIITDIGLPDGSGFDFCEEIRKTSNVYVIMLTALDEEFNAVMGYEIGADDYVTKPFSLAILVSKVKAFMKRAGNDEKEKTSENILISEDIEFDYGDYTLILNREDTEKVQLTKTEGKLLKLLMENAMNIIQKEQILDILWDMDGNFVDDNTVAVYMRRLRKKVEKDPSEPIFIKNIRGIGYKWNAGCVRK
ncbi:response regulator transcription factor [Peptacetobacter hiranonis]|uniref:response regulator transcription factor n=1 Tax=Peptacetobacter hiranonis TaxID=89152 RepID=UPI002E79F3A2|nr:response regulator transcription factor [Peptacetobacter hiranonis]MEE0247555.1 response regulator transcription factor [Peptacetobacter hiranonis]